MSEQALTKAILDAVNQTRLAVVWRCQSGSVRVAGAHMHLAPKGTPDIIGYLLDGTGRMLALEVKLPKGKLTPEQVAWGEAATARGVVYSVVRSVDQAVTLVRWYRPIPALVAGAGFVVAGGGGP